MPWRQVKAMNERFQFVRDARQRLVSFTDLCALYGVSVILSEEGSGSGALEPDSSVASVPRDDYGLAKFGLLSVSTSGSGTHVRLLYVCPLRFTPVVNGRLYRSMSTYRWPSLKS